MMSRPDADKLNGLQSLTQAADISARLLVDLMGWCDGMFNGSNTMKDCLSRLWCVVCCFVLWIVLLTSPRYLVDGRTI